MITHKVKYHALRYTNAQLVPAYTYISGVKLSQHTKIVSITAIKQSTYTWLNPKCTWHWPCICSCHMIESAKTAFSNAFPGKAAILVILFYIGYREIRIREDLKSNCNSKDWKNCLTWVLYAKYNNRRRSNLFGSVVMSINFTCINSYTCQLNLPKRT